MAKRSKKSISARRKSAAGYGAILGEISSLLESARRATSRSVNAILTTTYWEIGRRIVEFEQQGEQRAEYGEDILKLLSRDLTKRFGRGFSERNLRHMRAFYGLWPIWQTLSAKSQDSNTNKTVILTDVSERHPFPRFLLPWSHYVQLLSVQNPEARHFYEQEAIRGGWSIRQLNRQIDSLFYERTALSKNKTGMLVKGAKAKPDEMLTPEEEIKDPFILEFLDLKDEYSESDLEESLIRKLESFLLELGGDFTFVGRQRRLRIDDEWYRIDLMFFHRRLRCLVIIDLKLGKFTHADAGQMHLYLNYAREHWMLQGENPPVGMILCASKGSAMAKYALEGLPNKVMAAEYRTALPDEKTLVRQIEQAQKLIDERKFRNR